MVLKHGESHYKGYYHLVVGDRFDIGDDLIKELNENKFQISGHSNIPVAYTYFGQFTAHDITHQPDPKTKSGNKSVFTKADLENMRSPTLDLDSLYGNAEGFGNVPNDGEKFSVEDERPKNGEPRFFDLYRDEKGKAKIGDPRNDENMFLAQIHALFMSAHNQLVDLYKRKRVKQPFEQARKELTWIFQSLVRDDFLRRVLNPLVYRKLFVESGSIYLIEPDPNIEDIDIPYEFAVAAFRFGHSLVKGRYKIKERGKTVSRNTRLLFDLTEKGGKWREIDPDIFTVDWTSQVDLKRYGKEKNWQESEPIDPHIIINLIQLDVGNGKNKGIIYANLNKSNDVGLCSGQDVVKGIRAMPIGEAYCAQMELQEFDFSNIVDPAFQSLIRRHDLEKNMPLWTYILTEPSQYSSASLYHQRLGTLGSVLVGEVFRALLLKSRTSILRNDFDPDTSQFLKSLKSRFKHRVANGNEFGLEDLVTFVYPEIGD